MNDVGIEWLAGIIEGEGTFFLQEVSGGLHPSVHLIMSDLDVVERAALVFPGNGIVSEVKRRVSMPEHYKTCYRHSWTGRHGVDLMWTLLPFMGIRRTEKIVDILADTYEQRFKACTQCGESFFVPWHATRNRLFCSPKCNADHNRPLKSERNRRWRAKKAAQLLGEPE